MSVTVVMFMMVVMVVVLMIVIVMILAVVMTFLAMLMGMCVFMTIIAGCFLLSIYQYMDMRAADSTLFRRFCCINNSGDPHSI